MPNPA